MLLLSVISIAATTASVCMLLSPLLTVRAMATAGSVGMLTITFFCAQYMNCFVWSIYGTHQLALPIITCNTLGLAIATYCILVFLHVARKEERTRQQLQATTYAQCLATTLATLVVCLTFLAVQVYLAVSIRYDTATTLAGFAGGCCSVFMLSSPLGAVAAIVRSKNAVALQPVTVMFATMNSVLWTLYGVLRGDAFVGVPNALCTLACLLQIGLLLRYGRRSTVLSPTAAAAARGAPKHNDIV